jgi:hypothetical protein
LKKATLIPLVRLKLPIRELSRIVTPKTPVEMTEFIRFVWLNNYTGR